MVTTCQMVTRTTYVRGIIHGKECHQIVPVSLSIKSYIYFPLWGTGMIASGSTNPPPAYLGGIRDLFRLLQGLWHGIEAQVYSDYAREATAFTCLVIIFRLIVYFYFEQRILLANNILLCVTSDCCFAFV